MPGEKIVEAVGRRYRDVKCIFIRFRRNTGTDDQSGCEIDRFARYVREPQFLRKSDTCHGDTRISAPSFAENHG